jgi:uncharacterized membrane protein YcaP (DUF421 family)
MTNFGKTVRKQLIDLDKTQDWLAAQVEGTGIPCDKTYLSKILNGARKGKQVKAAIEKILDLEADAGSEEGDSMTNFGKTVRKQLIDLDKTQDWLAAQVEGTGIPCDKTYLSKILNGARKGKQVKAAIEKILDLEGGALGG